MELRLFLFLLCGLILGNHENWTTLRLGGISTLEASIWQSSLVESECDIIERLLPVVSGVNQDLSFNHKQ